MNFLIQPFSKQALFRLIFWVLFFSLAGYPYVNNEFVPQKKSFVLNKNSTNRIKFTPTQEYGVVFKLKGPAAYLETLYQTLELHINGRQLNLEGWPIYNLGQFKWEVPASYFIQGKVNEIVIKLSKQIRSLDASYGAPYLQLFNYKYISPNIPIAYVVIGDNKYSSATYSSKEFLDYIKAFFLVFAGFLICHVILHNLVIWNKSYGALASRVFYFQITLAALLLFISQITADKLQVIFPAATLFWLILIIFFITPISMILLRMLALLFIEVSEKVIEVSEKSVDTTKKLKAKITSAWAPNINKPLTYRAEIDGLRAIAVFAVILYHAGKVLKGGFIGVDVFFVISGYLITSFILREIKTEGSFSFLNFYERRVRRILPALLAVMIASISFAWVYLLPIPFIDYARSLVSSLLFSSNFYFWYIGEQYAAESALLKPLLHTWSLSVEEQFYVLYPIILLTCIRYFKKHLTTILIGGLLLSLLVADWGSKTYPMMSFYILPTRGWELLAGAILAKLEVDYGRTSYKVLSQSLPILGLFLIVHAIIFFTDQMFHPSLYTISPIVGTMLIIWFSNKDELISTILSRKLFVGFGLISYSLYLWHFPIFAFSELTGYPEDYGFIQKYPQYGDIFIAFLIIFLSVLTYFLVERPFRNKQFISTKALAITVISSSVILLVLSTSVVRHNGFYDRWADVAREIAGDENFGTGPYAILHDENGRCFGRFKSDFCSFNKNGENGKVFLVGDSQAGSLSSYLHKQLIRGDFQFVSTTAGTCPYMPGFSLFNSKTGKTENCDFAFQNKRKQQLLSSPNSIIILDGGFYNYLTSPTVRGRDDTITRSAGLTSSIRELLHNKQKVILVYPTPYAHHNIVIELRKTMLRKNFSIKDLKTNSYSAFLEKNKNIFKLLDSIQHPNLYRVYPHNLFCDNQIKGRCVTTDGKNVFYADTNHTTNKGSEMIVELIMKKIDKIKSNQ